MAVKLTATTAEFTARMRAAGQSLDSIGESAKRVSMAAAAGAAALGGLGVVATKTFAQFEFQMTRVGAISNSLGTKTFQQLKTSALDMAAATEFTAREVAEGMGFMAMAGNQATTIISAMPQVLNLATVGAIELGAAADIVTNILAGFGKESSELGKVNDILASAITGANVDVRMLGNAFKFVGPIAKSAGVGFNEVTASLALLGNAGIQGEMAGTALRNSIARLINPASATKKTLKELGVTVLDGKGKFVGLTEVIRQLGPHAQNTGAIMRIFGARAGPAMATLLGQGVDKLELFMKRLDESAGLADKIAKAQMATLTGQYRIMASAIERVAIQTGELLAPSFARVVKVITDAANWFSELDQHSRQLFVTLGSVATITLSLVAALSGVVALMKPLFRGLKDLAKLGVGVFRGILIPMAKVLAVLFIITTAIGALKRAWDTNFLGMQDRLRELTDIMRDDFGGALEVVRKILGLIAKALSVVVVLAAATASHIGAIFSGDASGVASIFELKKQIEEVLAMPAGLFAEPGENLEDTARSVGGIIADAGGEVKKSFDEGAKLMVGALEKMDLGKLAKGFVDTLKGMIPKVEAPELPELPEVPRLKPGVLPPIPKVPGAVKPGAVEGAMRQALPALGNLGKFAQSLIAGDWTGAILQVVTQTEGFQDALGSLEGIFGGLVDAINPLMVAIAPIIEIVGNLLAPILSAVGVILQGLAPILKAVAQLLMPFQPLFTMIGKLLRALAPIIQLLAIVVGVIINVLRVVLTPILLVLAAVVDAVAAVVEVIARIIFAIVEALAAVWNAIVDAVVWVLRAIDDAIGFLFVGVIGDFADEVESLRISMPTFESMMDMDTAVTDTAESFGELNDTIDDTMASLTNIPVGFKVALARYEATIGDPFNPGAGIDTGEGAGVDVARAVVNIANMVVQANNPREFSEAMEREAAWNRFHAKGSSLPSGGQYSLPLRGGVEQ
jgi:TP901 family phage tail tape measure protein